MNQKNSRYQNIVKAGSIIYPILVYFLVITFAGSICGIFVSEIAGIDGKEEYQKYYMMMQTMAAAVTIPFMYNYYRKDRKQPTLFYQHLAEVSQKKDRTHRIINAVLMFLTGAAAGIAMNNIMALTTLEKVSGSFQEVTENFFAGGVIFEILGACFLIPILEELLYRGVVYGRIYNFMVPEKSGETRREQKYERKNRFYAMLCASLIFGAMHMNIVQFIYAAVLGMMLAWFIEESGHLYGAVAAHMGANLMSVLRMETDIFQWMNTGRGSFLAATAGFAVISAALLVFIRKYNAEKV